MSPSIAGRERAQAGQAPVERARLRRRPLRRAAEGPITEGSSARQIRCREAVFRRSLAVADVLAAAVGLVVCVSVLGSNSLQPVALLAIALIIVVGYAYGLYDRDELVVNKTTIDQAPQLFQCATLYTLAVVLLQDTIIAGSLSAVQVVVLWVTVFLVAVLARRVARCAARRLSAVERCLFVGTDESFERLRSRLPDNDRRTTLVGRVALDRIATERLIDAGTVTLHELIEELDVHRVIIEPSEELPQSTLDFVREAKAVGLRVSLLPRILEVIGAAIEVDDVNGLTLLGVRRYGLSRSSKLIKRSFDVLGAAVALLLLAPLMAVAAILIRLDSPGPVFVRPTRVGRGGRAFVMWGFRTTQQGLCDMPGDPHMTRIGLWLRGASLDDLPQLFNVLRGEMSLVGPRPLVAGEDSQLIGLDGAGTHLTPGMTGHWQIHGTRVPPAELAKLDHLYVAGWSLWSDIKILLRTLVHGLTRRGL